MPTIVEADNGSVSNRALRSVVEFANILLLATKDNDLLAVSQLIESLTNISFNFNNIERCFK